MGMTESGISGVCHARVGDRGVRRIPLSSRSTLNLGFLVDGMASTAWAKLLNGKFLGLALLVFTGDIVAPFAPITLKPYKIPHFCSPCRDRLKAYPGLLSEAHDGNRTHDLFLTKEVLCRLSYVGVFSLTDWLFGESRVCRAEPTAGATAPSSQQGRHGSRISSAHRRATFSATPAGAINCGAGNGARTRDPELGRLALYQLSYSRSVR